MMPDSSAPEPTRPTKLHLGVDLRLVILVLLIAIAAMLLVWKPWNGNLNDSTRTISVTGNATVTATPDQYVFYPQYQSTNSDKSIAIAELNRKNGELVSKLKSLGVVDKNIKTDVNGYDGQVYDGTAGTFTYTLSLNVTVNDKDLAQKVQDYLITTSPVGAVSPNATFSAAKQKQLESQARDTATKEARSKADQSAKNLGFSVGKVKSVDDGGFNGSGKCQGPCMLSGTDLQTSDAAVQTLTVQPGQNDLDYSVTVVYYLR